MRASGAVLLVAVAVGRISAHDSRTPQMNISVRNVMATSMVLIILRPINVIQSWVTYQRVAGLNETHVPDVLNVSIKNGLPQVDVVLNNLEPASSYNICVIAYVTQNHTIDACVVATTFSHLDRAKNIIVAVIAVAVFLAVVIILILVLRYCKPYITWRKSLKFLKRRNNSTVGPEELQRPVTVQRRPSQRSVTVVEIPKTAHERPMTVQEILVPTTVDEIPTPIEQIPTTVQPRSMTVMSHISANMT